MYVSTIITLCIYFYWYPLFAYGFSTYPQLLSHLTMIQYFSLCYLICTTINKKEDGYELIDRGQYLDKLFLLFNILILIFFCFFALHPGGGDSHHHINLTTSTCTPYMFFYIFTYFVTEWKMMATKSPPGTN